MLGSQTEHRDPGHRSLGLASWRRRVLDRRGEVGADGDAGSKDLATREDKRAVSVAMLVGGLGGLPGRLALRCPLLGEGEWLGAGRLPGRLIDDLAVLRAGGVLDQQ